MIDNLSEQFIKIILKGETIEFAGKAIVALAADEDVIKKTGRCCFCLNFVFHDDCIDSSLKSIFSYELEHSP